MENTEKQSPGKVTGWEWFRSIGSPRTIVAPMVDQSDIPYRLLCRRYSADIAYTQMLNAPIFLNNPKYRHENIGSADLLERPLIAQIAGHDPVAMLKVGLDLQKDCDAVDVNLGCPQGIAKRGRYGAYLMEELDLLKEIVSTLANGLSVPVTCKTRIYKGEDGLARSIRLCETLVDAGASMLTIHGRTREEKGEWTSAADWDTLRAIKAHFARRDRNVPIIANGGISSLADVERCLAHTQCDGVMSSEAILENPALFSDSKDPQTGEHVSQLRLAEEYLALAKEHPPRIIKIVRGHIMKILYRYFTIYTDLRDDCQLRTLTVEDFAPIIASIKERLSKVSPEERTHIEAKEQSWYFRHEHSYNVDCGRNVRGMNKETLQANVRSKQAEEAWRHFEGDGVEEEDENWGGILSSLGMS